MTDKKIEGGGGIAPPPGAPHEVATDVPQADPREIAQRRAAAIVRAEERRAQGDNVPVPPAGETELAPFNPPALTREQMIALIGKTPEQVAADAAQLTNMAAGQDGIPAPTTPAPATTSTVKPPDVPRRIRRIAPPAPTVRIDGVESAAADGTISTSAEAPAEPPTDGAVLEGLTSDSDPAPPAPTFSHQPAASESDSPSRGIPRSTEDPGKRITGGFGEAGPAQYNPLNGVEVKEAIRGLMDRLDSQLDDDLRLTLAATYPRAEVRVIIEVNAYGLVEPMRIPKVMIPHTRTPIDVAREYADQVVFCIVAERREMTDDGTPVTSPNEIRDELGLAIPRKQVIQSGASRRIVDVLT